jgi:hypothetical protein
LVVTCTLTFFIYLYVCICTCAYAFICEMCASILMCLYVGISIRARTFNCEMCASIFHMSVYVCTCIRARTFNCELRVCIFHMSVFMLQYLCICACALRCEVWASIFHMPACVEFKAVWQHLPRQDMCRKDSDARLKRLLPYAFPVRKPGWRSTARPSYVFVSMRVHSAMTCALLFSRCAYVFVHVCLPSVVNARFHLSCVCMYACAYVHICACAFSCAMRASIFHMSVRMHLYMCVCI